MWKLAYIPEQFVLGATPSTPSSGYVKTYQKTDGFWYQLDDAGVETRITPYNQIFQALKTTALTSTTAFQDVVTWDTPTITEPIYSFDDATGVLTINDTGIFEVSFHALYDLLANNRIETTLKLVDSSGDVAGALDSQYSARNGTQDQGSAQLNNFLYSVGASGETLKLQELHVGANCQIIAARLTVKKVR